MFEGARQREVSRLEDNGAPQRTSELLLVVLQPATHLIDIGRVERDARSRAPCHDEIRAQSDVDRGPADLLISVKNWCDREIARRIAEPRNYLVAREENLYHLPNDAELA